MERVTQSKIASLAASLLASFVLLTACGQQQRVVDTSEASGELTNEEAEVVPKFVVTGLDKLPEKLVVKNLDLSISEIRLEPISFSRQGIAYASRTRTRLSFELGDGRRSEVGSRMALPRPGEYTVSVRLEPTQTSDTRRKPSLRLTGLVLGEDDKRASPEEHEADGNPMPVPFDEGNENTGSNSKTKSWTPFHYASYKTVYLTLGRVDLQRGPQQLAFKFNLHKWGSELVDPVIEAVRGVTDPAGDASKGIDVTRQVENQSGPAALVGSASLETQSIRAGR
jgi:hypothetical protein